MIAEKSKIIEKIDAISRPFVMRRSCDNQFMTTIFKAEHKHNLENNQLINYVFGRSTINEASDFELYCICEALMSRNYISELFTQHEINTYSSLMIKKIEKPLFPFHLKCVRINDKQYIGTISAKELHMFQIKQAIKHIDDSQRGHNFTINAVKKIENAYKLGEPVSDMLTVNIEPDSKAVLHYDEEHSELILESIDMVDLIDGYLRYLALTRLVEHDPDFDKQLELRILCEKKTEADKYINHETVQKKSNPSAVNDNIANIVTKQINAANKCILSGLVSADGTINSDDFSDIISYFVKNDELRRNEKTTQTTGRYRELLINGFNDIAGSGDIDFSQHKVSYKELSIMIYGIIKGIRGCDILDAINRSSSLRDFLFTRKKAGRTLFKEIDKLWEG